MRKEIADISTGGILLLLSVIGFVMAGQFGNGQTYGPDFFPKLILTLLAISATFLMSGGALRLKKEKSLPRIQIDRLVVKKVLLFTALLITYILLFFAAGFIISTILFLFASQWIFGLRNVRLLASVSVVLPILLYFIFTIAFKIPLP
ncbi:tripartite tricarboxylate transporter TctB family protein [Sporosarcina sp. UB5]|uniref:tripartite tricarboxylate transporter TctB family protein n=1 Tax=Sporosarcina sp. UB5 TaxID=3047463 RepID=UPI003D7AD4C0